MYALPSLEFVGFSAHEDGIGVLLRDVVFDEALDRGEFLSIVARWGDDFELLQVGDGVAELLRFERGEHLVV